MVNFLELEEPSIYGYGYAPRYISALVAKQGSLCENITIAFTLSNFYACAVIDKEKKRNPFNIWKCNELTLSHTAIYTLQYSLTNASANSSCLYDFECREVNKTFNFMLRN